MIPCIPGAQLRTPRHFGIRMSRLSKCRKFLWSLMMAFNHFWEASKDLGSCPLLEVREHGKFLQSLESEGPFPCFLNFSCHGAEHRAAVPKMLQSPYCGHSQDLSRCSGRSVSFSVTMICREVLYHSCNDAAVTCLVSWWWQVINLNPCFAQLPLQTVGFQRLCWAFTEIQ